MQIIHDQSLKQTNHDTLVQCQPQIHWADDQAVRGTVHLAEPQSGPCIAELVSWVDSVGGEWASDEDFEGI